MNLSKKNQEKLLELSSDLVKVVRTINSLSKRIKTKATNYAYKKHLKKISMTNGMNKALINSIEELKQSDKAFAKICQDLIYAEKHYNTIMKKIHKVHPNTPLKPIHEILSSDYSEKAINELTSSGGVAGVTQSLGMRTRTPLINAEEDGTGQYRDNEKEYQDYFMGGKPVKVKLPDKASKKVFKKHVKQANKLNKKLGINVDAT